jgi:hypothetical protein
VTPHTDDVEAVLRKATIKPARIERKPRATGPKPVPELDEHVQRSYETGDPFEVTVPEWAVADTKTLLRKSAKYVGHTLGKDIRLTLQTEAQGSGKVTIRFRARDVLNMGRRASQAKKTTPARSRKKV